MEIKQLRLFDLCSRKTLEIIMESYIRISNINDFIFCPISIYFHNLYDNLEKNTYQNTSQAEGTFVHKTIDSQKYSNRKDILEAKEVFSEELNLFGKIDIYNKQTGELIERKKEIKTIYDGYIFQLYAQYFCLIEMGYQVKKLSLYSYKDNKKYKVELPNEDLKMSNEFRLTLKKMNEFNLNDFIQNNSSKCANCIYFNSCDRGINYDECERL